jgi:hypothetical protein
MVVACGISAGAGAQVEREVRSFGATTTAIEELRDWLPEPRRAVLDILIAGARKLALSDLEHREIVTPSGPRSPGEARTRAA